MGEHFRLVQEFDNETTPISKLIMNPLLSF